MAAVPPPPLEPPPVERQRIVEVGIRYRTHSENFFATTAGMDNSALADVKVEFLFHSSMAVLKLKDPQAYAQFRNASNLSAKEVVNLYKSTIKMAPEFAEVALTEEDLVGFLGAPERGELPEHRRRGDLPASIHVGG
jgi:hypothetical protein